MNNLNRLLSYKDILFILNFIYDFKEDYNNKTCLVISGNINQFKKILENFNSNNECKILFCIINKNNHWTFLTIIKKKINEIYYFDSFGQKIYLDYFNIINNFFYKNLIFLCNEQKIQEDNYSCGYYCIYFIIIFNIIINKQNFNSIYYLHSFIEKNFFKYNFNYFLNKYKRILN